MSFNLGRAKGTDGNGIKDIDKTNTVGLNDIYTITMDDGTEYTFIVTNEILLLHGNLHYLIVKFHQRN